VAKLSERAILRLNRLWRKVRDKTGLDPLFVTDRESSVSVTGLNESFFAAYVCAARPHLRFSAAEETFYEYDPKDGRFKPMPVHLLQFAVLEDIRRYREAYAQENQVEADQIERFRNIMFAQKVVGQLQGRCHWQGRWNLWEGGLFVHCKNGVLVVDRKTGKGEFQGFSPKFNSKAQIPVSYDPKATCPLLTAELERRIPDTDQRELFLKCLGQFLVGQNLAHKIVHIRGEANTGKSQIADLAVKIIGCENCVEIRITEAAGRFEMAQYRDASLLKAFDVPANFLMDKNADILKKLTGGDQIGGERKFGNAQVSFRGDKNVLLTSNFTLQLREGKDEAALARRLVVIEWQYAPIAKRIANWSDYIMEREGSGILNLFLKGLELALADLNEGHPEGFRKTKTNAEAVDVVMERSNSVIRFVSKRVEKCDGARIFRDELEEAYNRFCSERHISPLPPKVFSNRFNSIVSEEFNAFKTRVSVQIDGKTDHKHKETAWFNVRLKGEESPQTQESASETPQTCTETAGNEATFDQKEADFLVSEKVEVLL